MKKCLVQVLLVFAAYFARGQGTFIYDQQSATNDSGGSGILSAIQSNQPFGQSFVPSLSAIGFFRLYLDDQTPSGSGATLFVNLWSGSISNGTLVSSTDPIFIPHGFFNYTNFFFSTPAPVVSSTTYYLQVILQSGDISTDIGMTAGFVYPNGTAVIKGVAQSGQDIWFREGIEVVPEPTMISLVLLGVAGIHFGRRKN